APGVCFIWIDAICIVQDDTDDSVWGTAKMPHVFKGTVITILALRAKSYYEASLQLRELDVSRPTFKLPC
ncbi:hypothetical protein AOQ84DRAFT_297287, partial [Glonium stellatum]